MPKKLLILGILLLGCSTVFAQTITVTFPNGGENLRVGKATDILWTWTGSFANVKIELSRDGGSTWNTLVDSTSNDGNWTWNPVTGPRSTACKVRVSDAADGNPTDESDANFAISPTDVRDETGVKDKPSEFSLSQNYPNPFNQTTKIEFSLPHSGFVSLNICNILGRKIRTLVSENLYAGYKSVVWDGKDDSGKEVASGIYFYRLKVGDYSEAKKLVMLK